MMLLQGCVNFWVLSAGIDHGMARLAQYEWKKRQWEKNHHENGGNDDDVDTGADSKGQEKDGRDGEDGKEGRGR